MELIKAGKNTYYVTGYFHVGVYILDDERNVCLIESGLDEKCAMKIDELLEERNLRVRFIINTHYHADHCGGNRYFINKYRCVAYATKLNAALISNFEICPAIVWGAIPVDAVINSYFLAPASEARDLDTLCIPEDFEIIELPGHCIGMIGVKTPDGVLFLGDAVVGEEVLEKSHVPYIFNVDDYLDSLKKLEKIDAEVYIPYHSNPVADIKPLVKANYENVLHNIETIKQICKSPKTMDDIISEYFSLKNEKITAYRYAVNGGVIKSYVSNLHNKGILTDVIIDNYVKWKTVE